MNTLTGISVRGKTYFITNTFSQNDLLLLRNLATYYRKTNLFIDEDDDTIIKQFIHDADQLLKLPWQLISINEILILK